MRTKGKRTASLLSTALTSIMAINLLAPVAYAAERPADLDTSGVNDFSYASSTSLGTAGGFAVFAGDFSNPSHMEGTIAAKTFHPKGNNFGVTDKVAANAMSSSYYYYFENIDTSASSHMGWEKGSAPSGNPYTIVLPGDFSFDFNYNNGYGVTLLKGGNAIINYNQENEITSYRKLLTVNDLPESKRINFDSALGSLAGYANNYMNTSNQTNIKAGDVNVPEGNVVYNIKYSDLRSGNTNIIYNDSVSSVIINVTDIPGDADFTSGFEVKFNGRTQDGTINGDGTMSVLWNLGSFGGTATFGEGIKNGVILAPNGTVRIATTHSGNVMARNVENVSGEIHQAGFKQKADAKPATTPAPSNPTPALRGTLRTTTPANNPTPALRSTVKTTTPAPAEETPAAAAVAPATSEETPAPADPTAAAAKTPVTAKTPSTTPTKVTTAAVAEEEETPAPTEKVTVSPETKVDAKDTVVTPAPEKKAPEKETPVKPAVAKVVVDGTEITPEDYNVTEENDVTLKPELTRTLAAGKHRVETTAVDGTVTETPILISADGEETTVPATGEEAPVTTMAAVIMLLISAGVFALRKKAEDRV